MVPRILVVDDDPKSAAFVAAALGGQGLEIAQAHTFSEASRRLEERVWSLVVSDVCLDSGKTGIDLIRQARLAEYAVPFVFMTGQAELETTFEALRLGAYDYLAKPPALDRLYATVKRALRVAETTEERLPSDAAGVAERLVGSSPSMVEVYKAVTRAALCDSPVLVLGESGVGKELVCSETHRRSPRSAGPMIVLSCDALGEGESERRLFGTNGALQAAHGGSVVLKHVNDLPVSAQLKLAAAIERRGGGEEGAAYDVRYLATVCGDRATAASLRRPLYSVLSVVPITVPALRDRGGDLPILAEELLRRLSPRLRRKMKLSREALGVLAAQSWKDNVRELANVLEAAGVAAVGEVIQEEDLLDVLATRRRPLREAAGETSPEATAPRFRDDRYVLEKHLATTGMSDVWLGSQPSLGRPVVIKFLKATAQDDLTRFKREAMIQATLRHPQIPVVYEVGTDELNEFPLFLAIEYVEGMPLDQFNASLVSNKSERRRIQRIMRVIAQMALVLDYLHSKGLVHRDIKPQNIIVTPEEEKAYLIDYGLTKSMQVSNHLTVAGTVQGTIPFMSPEHLTGRVNDVVAASDIWSLGATAYYLLTGRHPFGPGDFDSIATRIRTAEPEPAGRLNPLLSPGLERIILRTLLKDPSARYSRGLEMADDIDRELRAFPL